MGMIATDIFTLSILHTTNANTVVNNTRYLDGAVLQRLVTSAGSRGNSNVQSASSSSSPHSFVLSSARDVSASSPRPSPDVPDAPPPRERPSLRVVGSRSARPPSLARRCASASSATACRRARDSRRVARPRWCGRKRPRRRARSRATTPEGVGVDARMMRQRVTTTLRLGFGSANRVDE